MKASLRIERGLVVFKDILDVNHK
ncbi:hypothetical protein VAE122_160005 [Vibrio aestuarianus]|nr:hypothetical protein VAE122_160005 [Vibrio aestuarianus]